MGSSFIPCKKGDKNCYFQLSCASKATTSEQQLPCFLSTPCNVSNGGCQQICNSEGVQIACSCTAGFRLNNDKKTCSNINACLGFPCDANAVCADLNPPALNSTAGRTCECNDGYVGSGEPGQCAALGSSSAAAATSCKPIKDAFPNSPNGKYWLYPGGPALQIYCKMTVAGGGWTSLASALPSAAIVSGNKNYLYLAGSGNYFISPATSLNWDWNSGQQVTGEYTTPLPPGSVVCTGSAEVPLFGIGCSNGAGILEKVLPYESKDATAGTITACNHATYVFTGSSRDATYCGDNIRVFYRPT